MPNGKKLLLYVTLTMLITALSVVTGYAQGQWPSPHEKSPSYTIPGPKGSVIDNAHYTAPKDDQKLGEFQTMEVFETEDHLYKVPFRYKNVTVDGWTEYSDKGIEMFADVGTIVIVEQKPIVSVTILGSGCSSPCYNIVEWWGEGEDISNSHGQLIKRSRIDNLKGQHNAALQKSFTEKWTFKTAEEANNYAERMQSIVYNMTSGFYMPGSIMGGLYENTAYFRIGDVNEISRIAGDPDPVIKTVNTYKIVIRSGCLDYEDPGTPSERYPAEYAIRLIDVVVKK